MREVRDFFSVIPGSEPQANVNGDPVYKRHATAGFMLLFLLPIILAACEGYRMPGLSKDPARMSADTLCFQYASSNDPKLAAEIDARRLDCAGMLREDPLYTGPDESVYRMR